MRTRVYIKETSTSKRQTIFVATSSDIFDGKRYFDGFQLDRNGEWKDWDMAETRINKMIKEGMMVRIQ